MLQTILTPTNASILLSIPDEYIGKELEVTVAPLTKKPIARQDYMTSDEFWKQAYIDTKHFCKAHGII
ncbi:MAG: hypothetical protein LBV31_00040 [Prevotellaceae bacterium]|jgi:hypothetical protein|nr:hypothetical protein [Prevotellaceae bacterium]